MDADSPIVGKDHQRAVNRLFSKLLIRLKGGDIDTTEKQSIMDRLIQRCVQEITNG